MVFTMEQMKLFISKVQSDNELRAKLDKLACQNPDVGKVIELAAEYGFSITEEDYIQAKEAAEKAAELPAKSGMLNESDLASVAGGNMGSRHDYKICSQYDRTHYNCVGFLSLSWCYYFIREPIEHGRWNERCIFRYFDNEVDFFDKIIKKNN